MTTRATFAWPLVLGTASLAGLVAGLLGAGWSDVASWLGLAAPVSVAVWAWRGRTPKAHQRRSTP